MKTRPIGNRVLIELHPDKKNSLVEDKKYFQKGSILEIGASADESYKNELNIGDVVLIDGRAVGKPVKYDKKLVHLFPIHIIEVVIDK